MTSEVTIILGRSPHQQVHAEALAKGVWAHGITPILTTRGNPVRTKRVACWGWRYGQLLRDRNCDVLIMERGYLGDRFAWTSLGWNGLNGRATFYPKDDPSRFNQHFTLKPWKSGGDYVLLVGQVPGDASLGGLDLTRWYQDTAKQAATAYGLPVRFRPHPLADRHGGPSRPVAGAPTINGELAGALEGAAVAITFNSNAGVDAVLAGVPTVTLDQGSMAYDVAGHAIGERLTPPREEWAARLAWCQWTLAEIKDGTAWASVQPR